MVDHDSSFSYTATIMLGEVETLQQKGNSLQNALEELKTSLRGTLSPDHWTNSAAEEWTTIQTNWDTRTTEMQQKLVLVHKALENILNGYNDHEAKAASGWHGQGTA